MADGLPIMTSIVPACTFAQPLEVIAWRTTFSFGLASPSAKLRRPAT